MTEKQQRAVALAGKLLADALSSYLGEVGVDGYAMDWSARAADALAVISELQEAIGRDQATIDHEIRLLAEYLDTPDAHTGEAYIIEGSRRAVASILKLMEGE